MCAGEYTNRGMRYLRTGICVVPLAEAPWSAVMTKIVSLNHECFFASSRNQPTAQSVYLTAPARPLPEGRSMRPAGWVYGRCVLGVITFMKQGRAPPASF